MYMYIYVLALHSAHVSWTGRGSAYKNGLCAPGFARECCSIHAAQQQKRGAHTDNLKSNLPAPVPQTFLNFLEPYTNPTHIIIKQAISVAGKYVCLC